MDTILLVILAVVAILIVGPIFFADRSPIPETSGNVHKISTLSELDALLSSTTNVVIDFYADWCPPCRAIAPTFSKLADEHASKGKLAFAKVNVDHLQGAAQRYDVRAMPTFVCFKDGKPNAVAVKDVKGNATASEVERIQGANVMLLKGVVQALAGQVQS